MTRQRPYLASPQRRRLLQALAASGLLGALERNVALARTAPDYKALVCVFQMGGNDGENTLIPYDNRGYANYASIRTPASGLNIAHADLLPIQAARLSTPYGFHPACAPLKTLFDQKNLAVVANLGMLVRPSTKAGLETQGAPRPANLFSHADQQLALQSGDYTGFNRIGWGGRIADKLKEQNAGTSFPPLISTNGLRTFASGQTSIPLTVPENPFFTLSDSGADQKSFDTARDVAMQEILAQPTTNDYDRVAKLYSKEGLAAASVVYPILQNSASIVPQFFAGLDTSVARQLKTVALLIEGRQQTQLKRQVFYVNQGGYDTHAAQLPHHQQLLGDLAPALAAFQAAMTALGTVNDVTTFTLSDFGRTLKPASALGTDHGWGNYAFVIGGAVKGGDFYGTVPAPVLNGPDDLGQDGRWIPTTSLEQYGATLARWLGIAEPDLPYVFPNIGAFSKTDLGFMAKPSSPNAVAHSARS
jgi:uncharacterized protein (DUF1501 family)